MNRQTLQKIGGAALLSGAVLLTLWTVTWCLLLPYSERLGDFSKFVSDPDWVWIATTALFGLLFMLFGVTAVFSRICEKTGIFGLAGYVVLFIAYLIQFAKVTWEVFIYPILASETAALLRDRVMLKYPGFIIFQYAAMGTILLGVILFTIALIRSREFSLPAPVLFLSGAILYGIGPRISILLAITGVVVYAAGCVLIGFRLIRPGRDAAP